MSADQENMLQWGLFSSYHTPYNFAEAPLGFCVPDRITAGPSPAQFSYSITVGPDGTLQWNPPIGSEELALALSYHFPLHQTLEAKMQAAIVKYCDPLVGNWTETSAEVGQPQYVDRGNIPEQIKTPPKFGIQRRLRHKTGNVGNNLSHNSQESIVECNATPSKLASCLSDQCNEGKSGMDRLDGKLPALRRPKISILTWSAATGEVLNSTGKKRPYTEVERREVASNRGNACVEHRLQKKKCDPMKCSQNKQNLCHALTNTAASPVKTRSSPHSFQDPGQVQGQDPHTSCTSYPQSDDRCSNTLRPITISSANVGSHLDMPLQNNPGVETAVGAQYPSFNDLRPASQTTNSSCPPLSTTTNASSPGSSTISLQISRTEKITGAAECSGSDQPLATEDPDRMFSLYTTVFSAYDSPNITNHPVEIEVTPISNTDAKSDAEMIPAENYILPSSRFLYVDPSFIQVSNFETTSDGSQPPALICQRKPSFDELYMPSLCSSSNAETYKEQKPGEVYLMPPSPVFRHSSAARIEQYGGDSFCGAEGGSNGVVGDSYSPGRPSCNRTLSSRSVHSSITESPIDGKECANSVMRQNSVNSTTSQDSRYSTLYRGTSIYRREAYLQEIFRRDSTNSATSQESQHYIHEREYRPGSYLDRSRKSNILDTARRSSACDGDASPSSRGPDSDDIRTYLNRGRKAHTFRYDYKRGLMPAQRNGQNGSDCTDQEQSMEQLTSGLEFTHI